MLITFNNSPKIGGDNVAFENIHRIFNCNDIYGMYRVRF